MNKNLKKLTISAMMIALSTVLSLIKIFQLPLGGSITLLSMVPVCLIAVFYGTAYAVTPCVLYGAIQMFLDGVFGWGLTAETLIGAIVFDYLVAFGVLCLSGLFCKNEKWGVLAGVALACAARFVSHFISGCIFFQSFDVFNNPYLYSLCYNGAYMLPELVITCIGVYLLTKTKVLQKLSAV